MTVYVQQSKNALCVCVCVGEREREHLHACMGEVKVSLIVMRDVCVDMCAYYHDSICSN